MKHTPGPWVYQHGDIWKEDLRHMARRGKIADVSIAFLDSETRDANAHLIAASPALLEALRNCLSLVELKFGNTDPTGNAAIEQARTAIAKARGETE